MNEKNADYRPIGEITTADVDAHGEKYTLDLTKPSVVKMIRELLILSVNHFKANRNQIKLNVKGKSVPYTQKALCEFIDIKQENFTKFLTGRTKNPRLSNLHGYIRVFHLKELDELQLLSKRTHAQIFANADLDDKGLDDPLYWAFLHHYKLSVVQQREDAQDRYFIENSETSYWLTYHRSVAKEYHWSCSLIKIWWDNEILRVSWRSSRENRGPGVTFDKVAEGYLILPVKGRDAFILKDSKSPVNGLRQFDVRKWFKKDSYKFLLLRMVAGDDPDEPSFEREVIACDVSNKGWVKGKDDNEIVERLCNDVVGVYNVPENPKLSDFFYDVDFEENQDAQLKYALLKILELHENRTNITRLFGSKKLQTMVENLN